MRENILRHRPAVLTATGLAAGIALAGWLHDYAIPYAVIAAVIAAAVAALLLLLPDRLATARIALILLASTALGAGLADWQSRSLTETPLHHLAELRPTQIVVKGQLLERRGLPNSEQWIVQTDSVAIWRQQFIPISGRLLLSINAVEARKGRFPLEGTRIKVYSTLEPFRAPTNPFEYASDLKLQFDTRCEARGEIASFYDVYRLAPPPPPTLITQVGTWIEAFRTKIVSLLDTAVQDIPTRGFIEAVVLGERSDMSQETLDDFSTAGVSHILAVSGFNVAIIAIVVAQLLRLFGLYWHKPRTIVSMLVVLIYCALVGFQPSVIRALIMIELVFLARLAERKPDGLNIVASAVLLNLLIRPSDLFDVGFQLSYGAVLGLVLITPEFQRLLQRDHEEDEVLQRKIRYWINDALSLSLGASLATYPIISTHFYRISLIGLAANIPMIPLSSLVTALGFLLVPITAISVPLGQLYGEGTSYVTRVLLSVTRISAHVPLASHEASSPNWVFIVFFAICLVYTLRASTFKHFIGRLSLCAAACGVLILSGLPATSSVLAKNEGKLQVLFFDVGQGDCIYLETPNHHSYFIDFGTVARTGVARFDRAVLPFLRAENTTHVTAGFISHMHLDHFGGASTLLEHGTVATLYTSGERVRDPQAHLLDSLAASNRVHCCTLSASDTLSLDSDVTLYVLHPERRAAQSLATAYGQNANGGSLVFRIVYRKTSFLFLGDIERSEEQDMLQTYGTFLKSTVVKVAHHGSLTSSSREFVRQVQPKYAVISVGEHNRYGHPAPAIVRRWIDGGANVLRTDLDGASLLVSDGLQVQRENWQ